MKPNLTPEQLSRAADFFAKHTVYVRNLVRDEKLAYPPTLGEDKNRPELWKGAHWKWFLENSSFMDV